MVSTRALILCAVALAAFIAAVVFWPGEKSIEPAQPSGPTVPRPPTQAQKQKTPSPVSIAKQTEDTTHRPERRNDDFETDLRSALGSDKSNFFKIYKEGLDSDSPEKRYLAFRAYDSCLPYVRPMAFPRLNPFPDGESMRRHTAIQMAMKERCFDFQKEQITDFIRNGKKLSEWFQSAENILSPNYVSMPRDPSASAVSQARERLSEVLGKFGPALIVSGSGPLANWLAEASRSNSGIYIDPRLKSTDPLYAASTVAICHAGFDCSAMSSIYGVTCGAHYDCQSNFEEAALSRLDQKTREIVRTQAKVIGEALLRRDPVPLGLLRR